MLCWLGGVCDSGRAGCGCLIGGMVEVCGFLFLLLPLEQALVYLRGSGEMGMAVLL